MMSTPLAGWRYRANATLLAYRGTPEAMNEELHLMRTTIVQHDVKFHVGVCEDERLQAIYGANGCPLRS